MELPHIVRIVLGSLYGSGHGKSEIRYYKSNYDSEKLALIHKTCESVLGFRIGDICSEYGQTHLTQEQHDTLKVIGIVDDNFFYDEGSLFIDTDSLFYLWIEILKHLDPTVEIEELSFGCLSDNTDNDYPGYGLFD